MALDMKPSMIEKYLPALGRAGLFCVDDLTGAMIYALPIVAPPQLKGPQPQLRLEYNSNLPGDLPGFGWDLKGIPALTRIGDDFYAEGQRVSPQTRADGSLCWRKSNGSHVIFAPPSKRGGDLWQATRICDVFGNFIAFRYVGDKPDLITYGLAGDKVLRRIELAYAGDGYLKTITTFLAGYPVRAYEIVRNGAYVAEIHLVAFTAAGVCHALEAPLRFLWTGSRITAVTEPCGQNIAVEYAEADPKLGPRNTVASYTVTSRDLKGPVDYKVSRGFSGGQTHPLHGWIFGETTEWDDAARAGRYVVFHKEAALSHLAHRMGTFAAAAAKTAGTNSIALRHDGKGGQAFHHKLAETTYEYLPPANPLRAPLLHHLQTVQYGEEGVPLFTHSQNISYNDQGLPVKIEKGGTTETLHYQQVSGRLGGRDQDIFVPAGSSLFDGVQGGLKLLKRTELRYDFGDPLRPFAPTALRQTSWLGEAGGMSVPETVFFDPSGHPERVKNALGVMTEITCDAYHFPQKITHTSSDGDQRLEEYETDPQFGLPLEACDHKGIGRRMVYDAFGGLVEEWGVDPGQPKTWGDNSKLVRLSRCISSRDAKTGLILQEITTGDKNRPGRVRQYLDAFGRVLRLEKKIGRSSWQVELTEYEGPGKVARRSLPFLQNTEPLWVEMPVDDYGRDIGQKFPDGRGTLKKYHHDPATGTLEIRSYITSPARARKLVGRETYDQSGLIARRRETDSDVTRYVKDVLGRVTCEIDPCGVETTYGYDALDRCILEENAVWGTRRYHFDGSGLLAQADMNGEAVTYHYDGFGRVVKKLVTAGNKGRVAPQIYEIDYSSKPGSPLEQVRETMPGGYAQEITFAPNGVELERKVILGKGVSFSLSSGLNASGGLASRKYPNGAKIRNDYTQGGLLKRVFWAEKPPLDWGRLTDPIVEYQGHDSYGRPEVTHLHNGVSEVRRYNEYGQTTELAIGLRQARIPAYLHQSYSYTSDMDGLLAGIMDQSDPGHVKTQAFDYDAFDRLHSHSLSGPDAGFRVDIFGYGKAGNVTNAGGREFTGANPYQVEREKSGLDQAFDRNGNLVFKKAQGKRWSHQFDADNRLLHTSVSENGAEACTEYVYDFDGGRFLKVDPDGVRSFYLAPDYQITVYPDGRILGTIKVQGAGGTVATVTEPLLNIANFPQPDVTKDGKMPSRRGTGRYEPGIVYLHKNNLGSILLATNALGEKTASLGWSAWGDIDEATSQGVYNFELQFAGMIHDPATGLHYAGDRYYDPDSLRFLSPDRARASSDPYSYTSGDPVNYIDYNGMWRWWDRVVNWWNSPKTAQTGSRFQRVATVCVNALATVTILSDFYQDDRTTADGLLPFLLFMSGFSITFQTLDFIVNGNHQNSCLAPVWRRICGCRAFCTTNQAIISMISGTVASAVLFPTSLLTYNGLLEARYDHNVTLYANSSATAAAIGISVPRGLLAGFLASLPGLALMSPGLPFLAFAQSSVLGGVLMELISYELAFVAFSGGDILVQILLAPGQFSAAAQFAITSRLLIIAPLIASRNPLIALLPISNIPGLTTGPMLLADNTRAPFFPPFCCRPCDEDDSSDEDGPKIEELPDLEEVRGGDEMTVVVIGNDEKSGGDGEST